MRVFKPWLSIRVFLQGCLATSFHDEIATHKMYQPWKGRMSIFLIKLHRKPGDQWMGISPAQRNLNCGIKWLPSCHSGGYNFKPDSSAIHSTVSGAWWAPDSILFPHFFFADSLARLFCFSVILCCINFFWFFPIPTPPPITFLMVIQPHSQGLSSYRPLLLPGASQGTRSSNEVV